MNHGSWVRFCSFVGPDIFSSLLLNKQTCSVASVSAERCSPGGGGLGPSSTTFSECGGGGGHLGFHTSEVVRQDGL